MCKSLQSRGDSSRKLSPFFVETASHHKGAIVIYFSSHHKNGENVSEIMMMMVKMMVEMIMQLVGPNQIMRCFLIALTSSSIDILRLLPHFLTRANCSRKVCEIEPWSLTPAPPYQRGMGSWCQWFDQFSPHFRPFLEENCFGRKKLTSPHLWHDDRGDRGGGGDGGDGSDGETRGIGASKEGEGWGEGKEKMSPLRDEQLKNKQTTRKDRVFRFPNPLAPGSDIQVHVSWGTWLIAPHSRCFWQLFDFLNRTTAPRSE